jgi:hypothetical protein
LTKIEERAFYMCRSLEFFCVPASVQVLGSSCFAKCDVLTSVTFEENSQLQTTCANIFSESYRLQPVSIPPASVIIHKERGRSAEQSSQKDRQLPHDTEAPRAETVSLRKKQ